MHLDNNCEWNNDLYGARLQTVHRSRRNRKSDARRKGAPVGIGFGRKPPVFIRNGGIVTSSMGPLGSFNTRFVGPDAGASAQAAARGQ